MGKHSHARAESITPLPRQAGEGKGIRTVQKTVGTFLAAMLYGASWIVVLIDLLAILGAAQQGGSVAGYLPTMVGGLIVIAMIHYSAGWFPFRRPRQPG